MTKMSPKSNSYNETNGRGSYANNFQVEDRTYQANYPPSLPYRMQSAAESATMQMPHVEAMQRMAQTQKIEQQRWNITRWFSGSLRIKVTALAIALGIVPVGLIGTIAYFTASQKVDQQVISTNTNSATDIQDKLESFITERYGDIQVLSNLPALANPKVRELLGVKGQETVLNRFVQVYGYYDSIAFFDLEGNLIAQSQGESLPNAFDQDYFQGALKSDRPYIGEPRISVVTKTYSIFVATKVKDTETGQTIGIVRTRMPMTAVEDALGIKSERAQDVYVFGNAGEIIASNVPDVIQKKIEERFAEVAGELKKKGEQVFDLITKVDKEEQLVVYLPSDDLKKLYNINWGMLIATPTNIAFAAKNQLLFTLLLGTAATTVAVGALGAFVTNRGIQPILAAAEAVDKIGQGDLNTRLDVEGDDELANLEQNINKMANQLGEFVQEQELAAEQARLLADITGSRIVNSQDLKNLFNKALDQARNILQAERLTLYRLNPNGSGYFDAESVAMGWPRSLDKIEYPVIPEEQLKAYKDGQFFVFNNVFESDISPDQMALMARLGVKANLEVAILHDGQPYALLMAHQCSVPREWQPSEISFLKQLAGQLGLVIDRVVLLEETEKLAQEQRQLKEGLQQRALELLKEVDPISKGDLTIRARVTADEIGTIADSYNATVTNLRKIVEQVQEAAGHVAKTTTSSERSVQELSTEALRQAEEIAVALEKAQEMAQAVRLVAANAEQAEAAVQQAAQTVAEGDANMNQTVEGILAIRETVAETAKKVKHLGESSQKISTVVSLISTFAAQTNLLALNASIEAARAGEEGRGFAVVADEVRALARQSAEATAEIEKLVAAIQGETNEVVAAMEAGTEQVVAGTKLVDKTRQSLNKITAASTEINDLVEAIAQATIVQSQASEAVTQTMTDVAQIAARTSAEAGQVSYSFEQLRLVAQALQEDVGQFKLS